MSDLFENPKDYFSLDVSQSVLVGKRRSSLLSYELELWNKETKMGANRKGADQTV